MSKLQLKKELAGLDKEQLIQLVLDAYDSRKETKEYFEFFLNPDVEKLRDKFEIEIAKELNKYKRGGYSKARISFLKKLIKDFVAFQPGYEAHLELLFYTLNYAMLTELHLYFTETLERGVASLIKQIVELADRNGIISQTLDRLYYLFNNEHTGSRYFRQYLAGELQNVLNNYKVDLQH